VNGKLLHVGYDLYVVVFGSLGDYTGEIISENSECFAGVLIDAVVRAGVTK